MKKFLPAVFSFLSLPIFAQELVQVNYGMSYAQHVFYRLSDDETANFDNGTWDVAFTTTGNGVAGIHLNETAVVFGQEAVLFLAPTDNFDDPIDPADLTERLLNDEQSWEFGAFNSPRDPGNPNDFGWGLLDPGTGAITGNRVFVLAFKSDAIRKIQIVSYDQGVYTLKHAELDGSDEVILTLDGADFPDHDLAFLSLETGQVLENVPSPWDLLFIRYSSPFDDGAGGIADIMTSGVLTAPGIEVAEARWIVPTEVTYDEYEDSLSANIDVIGSDWKIFNNVTWEIPADLAYFVKTPAGQVWKLIFLDFTGSSTGNVVFSKEELEVSATREEQVVGSFGVSPNPVRDEMDVVFSTKKAGKARLALSNPMGQPVWTGQSDVAAGLNAFEIRNLDVPPGPYFLTIELAGEILTRKILKI